MTITQASMFSGARQALFWVATFLANPVPEIPGLKIHDPAGAS